MVTDDSCLAWEIKYLRKGRLIDPGQRCNEPPPPPPPLRLPHGHCKDPRPRYYIHIMYASIRHGQTPPRIIFWRVRTCRPTPESTQHRSYIVLRAHQGGNRDIDTVRLTISVIHRVMVSRVHLSLGV